MRRICTLVILLPAIGCQDKATPGVALPLPPRPVVEITPEARVWLNKIAADQKLGPDWWVRMTVVFREQPEIEVALDRATPRKDDVVVEADGLRCVMAADQKVYLKGARVDWIKGKTKAGFDVTFPHRDVRDEDRASEWLRQETAKQKQ